MPVACNVSTPFWGIFDYHDPMQLKDWLKQNNLTLAQFADRTSFSKGAAMKWVSGERFPRMNALIEIERITNGEVTAIDFQKQIQQIRS